MTREDWLVWRKKGIGSSDAPAVLGVSPWMTPLGLWEVKTGRRQEPETNWAMQRGVDLEPRARAHYELLCDIEMPAALYVHQDHAFLRASLDGFNPDARRVLEIKCPGKDDHAQALSGKVPEKYVPQLAHQLLVTGAEQVDYFSFDGEKGVIVPFRAERSLLKTLFEKESEFWDYVLKDLAPPLSPKDFRVLRDKESVALFQGFKEADRLAKEAAAKREALRAQIIEKHEEPRVRCAGVELTRSSRKGAVDYARVPELKGVDLEPYRKKASVVTTLEVKDED